MQILCLHPSGSRGSGRHVPSPPVLRLGEVRNRSSDEICLHGADHVSSSNYMHAARQIPDDIHTAILWKVLFVAIAKRDNPRFPTSAGLAASERSCAVNELVIGIGFPVR